MTISVDGSKRPLGVLTLFTLLGIVATGCSDSAPFADSDPPSPTNDAGVHAADATRVDTVSADGSFEDRSSDDGASDDGSSGDAASEDGSSPDRASRDRSPEGGAPNDAVSEDGSSDNDAVSEDGSSDNDAVSEDGSPGHDAVSEDGSSPDRASGDRLPERDASLGEDGGCGCFASNSGVRGATSLPCFCAANAASCLSYDEAVACPAGGVSSAVIERYSDCDYINVRMDSPILSQWRVYSAATLELVGVVRIYDTVTRCGDSRVPQIDAGINPITVGCQPSTRVAACPADGSP